MMMMMMMMMMMINSLIMLSYHHACTSSSSTYKDAFSWRFYKGNRKLPPCCWDSRFLWILRTLWSARSLELWVLRYTRNPSLLGSSRNEEALRDDPNNEETTAIPTDGKRASPHKDAWMFILLRNLVFIRLGNLTSYGRGRPFEQVASKSRWNKKPDGTFRSAFVLMLWLVKWPSRALCYGWEKNCIKFCFYIVICKIILQVTQWKFQKWMFGDEFFSFVFLIFAVRVNKWPYP